MLGAAVRPMTLSDVEGRFTARGRWRDRLPTILDTLEALGRARGRGHGKGMARVLERTAIESRLLRGARVAGRSNSAPAGVQLGCATYLDADSRL